VFSLKIWEVMIMKKLLLGLLLLGAINLIQLDMQACLQGSCGNNGYCGFMCYCDSGTCVHAGPPEFL